MFRIFLIIFLLSLPATYASAEENRINFVINSKLFESSVVIRAVDDATHLLKQSFKGWSVTTNRQDATINIRLKIRPVEKKSRTRGISPPQVLIILNIFTFGSRNPRKGGVSIYP